MMTLNTKLRSAQAAVTLLALGSFGTQSSLAAEESKNGVVQVSATARTSKNLKCFPDALPTSLNGGSLVVLPEGGLLLSGRSRVAGKPGGVQQTFLWRNENSVWESVSQQGLGGSLNVSTLKAQNLCVKGTDGFVSKDGGKSWNKAFSQYINVEGGRMQVGQSYWSSNEADTLLLSEMKFGSPSRIVKLDINTGKMTLWSSTEAPITRYHAENGKHYAWLGSPDSTPIKCVISSDDGKTWTSIPAEQSPWALHASAQSNIAKLTHVGKSARMSVTWAFEMNGTAFCRAESLVGEQLPANTPTIFSSSDKGKTWLPVDLKSRNGNMSTIFAGSPFVTKPGGALDPNSPIQVTIDKANNIVFASKDGEWFYTVPNAKEWRRVNTSALIAGN